MEKDRFIIFSRRGNHLKILFFLLSRRGNKVYSIRQLASSQKITQASASNRVRGLINLKLIKRDVEIRRRKRIKIIKLTKRGREFIKRIFEAKTILFPIKKKPKVNYEDD